MHFSLIVFHNNIIYKLVYQDEKSFYKYKLHILNKKIFYYTKKVMLFINIMTRSSFFKNIKQINIYYIFSFINLFLI